MQQRKYQWKVEYQYAGYTVYDFLQRHLPEYSEKTIRKMLHNQIVLLHNTPIDSSIRLKTGEQVKIAVPRERLKEYPVTPLSLKVIYETDELLVVNKEAGVAVIPERWSHQTIFKQALRHYLGEQSQPRIVHRIDKDASGAVLVAKNAEMERYLGQLFEQRTIDKEYLALVAGIPYQDSGRIEAKLAQASSRSSRMIISEFGKSAVTHYRLLEAFRDFALLGVRIETGRSHQIRVHLASQGYPLAIDPLYGFRSCLSLSEIKSGYQTKKTRPEKPLMSRLTLHARSLAFTMPQGEKIQVEAPLPDDFTLLLKMLRKYRPQGVVESY